MRNLQYCFKEYISAPVNHKTAYNMYHALTFSNLKPTLQLNLHLNSKIQEKFKLFQSI